MHFICRLTPSPLPGEQEHAIENRAIHLFRRGSCSSNRTTCRLQRGTTPRVYATMALSASVALVLGLAGCRPKPAAVAAAPSAKPAALRPQAPAGPPPL